jgi:CheY-like chemotaxis protein
MTSQKAPYRALLVDDNQHGNIARKSALEEIGLVVETATSGEEALEMFSRNPFDLLVTDFQMPRMNGIELISRIQSAGGPVRTILLTGWTVLGLTEESTGADVVMWKCNKESENLQRNARQLLARRPARKTVNAERQMRMTVARSV